MEVLSSVQILDCDRPAPDDARVVYREALLDLCLPQTPAGRKRADELRLLLTGDLQSSVIEYHSRHRVDRKVWASRVATALLPDAVPVFLASAGATA